MSNAEGKRVELTDGHNRKHREGAAAAGDSAVGGAAYHRGLRKGRSERCGRREQPKDATKTGSRDQAAASQRLRVRDYDYDRASGWAGGDPAGGVRAGSQAEVRCRAAQGWREKNEYNARWQCGKQERRTSCLSEGRGRPTDACESASQSTRRPGSRGHSGGGDRVFLDNFPTCFVNANKMMASLRFDSNVKQKVKFVLT